MIPANKGHSQNPGFYDDEDNEDEYDISPNEDELEDDESDELDTLQDPRITEVASEDGNEAPKLVHKEEHAEKGKNKRAREDSEDETKATTNLDDMLARSLKPAEPKAAESKPAELSANTETKLSKKQLKKMKNNAGKAVEAAVENKNVKIDNAVAKDSPALKGDKKVQFAKNLEQGPASSPEVSMKESKDKPKSETTNDDGKSKASLGVKTVQGVKIDDKKLGTGPAAKKGSKVGLRYIGKLQDGKQFDGMPIQSFLMSIAMY